MSQMGSFEWFKEKLDRWATAYAVIVSVPIVGGWIKGWFDKFGEKAGQKIENKVGQALGINVDEAKGFDDEILFGEAKRHLLATNQQQVEDFRFWLREKDKRENTKKAAAFVLGVAKAVKAFEKQIKKTDPNGGGRQSGKPREKTERSFMEYDHSWTDNFFARLITRATDEDKEEFVFIEENFQSLIPTEKEPIITSKKIQEVGKRIEVHLSDMASHVTEINQKIAGRSYEGFQKELGRLIPWRKKP